MDIGGGGASMTPTTAGPNSASQARTAIGCLWTDVLAIAALTPSRTGRRTKT
jgi:hypothetical protein